MTESTRHNILLIEDDSVAAELVRRQLASSVAQSHNVAFDVTWVKYLREGVEHLSDGECDVVLLDLLLPDSRGLESIERLLDCDADAAIVVLTGMDDSELAIQAAHEGARSFFEQE